MTDDAVSEIKSRLDILEVVGGYVTLHRSGGQHTGLCPLHPEKSPSFVVSQAKQVWHCHGCHEGGDIFTFIQKIERVDFARALEILAERAGVELERAKSPAGGGAARRRRTFELNDRSARFYEHVLWNLPAGEPGRRLLAERGVDAALARLYRVGFAPAGGQEEKDLVRYLLRRGAEAAEIAAAGLSARGGRDLFRHRLVFPISDERGQVLAFGGRALGDARPKYLNTPETGVYHKSSALFGLEQARDAIRARRQAVVVEGYFDVIAAHAAGVLHTIASSGTALTKEQARLLARQADVAILCFDGDEAGRMAASRAVDVCAGEGLLTRIAVMPEGVKDPDEMVRKDAGAFSALIDGAAPEWQVLVEWAIGDAGGRVEERRAAAERVVAVLVRIPAAATRDLYVQEASRRLGLSAPALAADVDRALARPARGAIRVTAPPAVEIPPDAGRADDAEGLEGDDPGHPLLPWEEYLGTYVLHRPALARLLVGTMGFAVDELASHQVRRLVEMALGVPDGVGFPVHALGPADRRLAAALLVRDVPELAADAEPGAVERAIADCVERVRFAARQDRAQRGIQEILATPAGADAGDDDGAAARLRQLIADQREPSGRD